MREFLIIIAVSDSPTEVTKHEISSCFASNPVLEDLTATSYHACYLLTIWAYSAGFGFNWKLESTGLSLGGGVVGRNAQQDLSLQDLAL